jgi:hypothetical protein
MMDLRQRCRVKISELSDEPCTVRHPVYDAKSLYFLGPYVTRFISRTRFSSQFTDTQILVEMCPPGFLI